MLKRRGEFVASYLEAERGYGVIRSQSASEIAEDSTQFAKSMQELSYMTGKSKQELMKQVQAMQQNVDVWASVTSRQ